MTSKSEARRLNERRIDLIDRKYSLGLNPEQAAELANLNTKVAMHVRRIAPRDTGNLDEQHERLTALKAKVAARRVNGK